MSRQLQLNKIALTALFFLSTLPGCRTPVLEVDLVYVGARSLASYWVCTPDPQLIDPPVGQRLVLMWRLSQKQFQQLVAPKLHLRVRLADYEEKSFWWDITTPSGKVIYSNVGTNECPPPNIGTYRVEIESEGKVVYCVEQALWTEWIQLQGGELETPDSALTPFQSSTQLLEPTERSDAEEFDEDSPDTQGQKPYVWDDLEEIKREP